MEARPCLCAGARRLCRAPIGLAHKLLEVLIRHRARNLSCEAGRPTVTQEFVGAQIVAAGGRWAVVRTVEEVADLVYVWGEGTPIRKVRRT